MKVLLGLFSLLITVKSFAWGAPDLASKEIRKYSTSISTDLDKKKAYIKVLVWSSKEIGDSNSAIKLKEPDLGLIVAKGNISCSALKLGNGWGKDQRIDFDIEITADDKKIDFQFGNIVGRSAASFDDGTRPSNKEEMDKVVKDCLDPLVARIKEEIK